MKKASWLAKGVSFFDRLWWLEIWVKFQSTSFGLPWVVDDQEGLSTACLLCYDLLMCFLHDAFTHMVCSKFNLPLSLYILIYIYYIYNCTYVSIFMYMYIYVCNYVFNILFLRYLDITTTQINWPLPTFSTSRKTLVLCPDSTPTGCNSLGAQCCGVCLWYCLGDSLEFPTTSGGSTAFGGGGSA